MHNTLTRTSGIKLDIDGHEDALAATQRAFNAASWCAEVRWEEGITESPPPPPTIGCMGRRAHALAWGAARGLCQGQGGGSD